MRIRRRGEKKKRKKDKKEKKKNTNHLTNLNADPGFKNQKYVALLLILAKQVKTMVDSIDSEMTGPSPY